MKFVPITDSTQLNNIIEESKTAKNGVLIFKHSTRCAISKMALNRIEAGIAEFKGQLPIYYLDLIRYRSVSNEVSQRLDVRHESPQVILLKDASCVYHTSHNDISVANISQQINA